MRNLIIPALILYTILLLLMGREMSKEGIIRNHNGQMESAKGFIRLCSSINDQCEDRVTVSQLVISGSYSQEGSFSEIVGVRSCLVKTVSYPYGRHDIGSYEHIQYSDIVNLSGENEVKKYLSLCNPKVEHIITPSPTADPRIIYTAQPKWRKK